MAKMTGARVERWQKDLDKALQLIKRVSRDLGDAKLTTEGGVYSNVIDSAGALVIAEQSLESLVSGDRERSGIERIRQIVFAAAASRKNEVAIRSEQYDSNPAVSDETKD